MFSNFECLCILDIDVNKLTTGDPSALAVRHGLRQGMTRFGNKHYKNYTRCRQNKKQIILQRNDQKSPKQKTFRAK